MSAPQIKLLVSRFAFETWGSRIEAAVPAGTIGWLIADDAALADTPCPADIAFMTREVTGASSKGNPTPELRRFISLVRAAPGLRWLQIHPAGAELPVYSELRARGVKVTTASGATSVTVAHAALGGLIAINRRFPLLADAQRRHAWEPRLGALAPRDLGGQHAVVVGLGPIGQSLAPLLKLLSMRVTGVRRKPEAVPSCDDTITFEMLPAAVSRADVIVLCCPASPLTRGLLDARLLARMPAGGLLVNVSRGEVAVEADVVAALASGHLAGAYLDVFEREPLAPGSPLWDLPNVIISPHTASHSLGQNEAIFRIFLDNLDRWRRNAPLRNDLDNLL
jgi:phosphoglycerate dehydrogenase-like enzyme